MRCCLSCLMLIVCHLSRVVCYLVVDVDCCVWLASKCLLFVVL